MARRAVIDQNSKVVNVVEYNDGDNWNPPVGCQLLNEVVSQQADIGDTWNGVIFIKGTPPITPPTKSSHIATIIAITVGATRPAKVRRIWNGINYDSDCFVSQTVKDEYMAGNINIGDYVLVHYDDNGEQLVTAKVFKSW